MISRGFFVFALGIAISGVARAQVTLDGDLSDLIAVAQGQQADPINEICLLERSGFDLSHVYVYWDCQGDAVYVGLDIMDVPPGLGTRGVGVPGDADGDGNPDTNRNPFCVAPPFLEQPGVGMDEFYIVRIDTNGNGFFSDPGDLWVQYRNNAFSILDPNQVAIPGATGAIQLGTAGCPVDTSIPDEDENRDTTDIEIRIDHWSQLAPTPGQFELFTINGAVFDGLAEDATAEVLFYVDEEPARLTGNVNAATGPITDVLRINGDPGSVCTTRQVVVSRAEPITLSLDASPAGPMDSHYVVWLWSGTPRNATDLTARGVVIGTTALPTPLTPRLQPQPFACLRSPGAQPLGCGHAPDLPSPQFAPWTMTRSQGISHPIVVTAQGVIEDAGAANAVGLSITNAVILVIR
ncbi:MAG: hypothetical protein HYR85_23310 [Planctomycetes bacterium]|nr:hypothetical protein [Planctomycetota bacterium]MBI3847051.1 hypothetical protein [Planctomycetota bacterium]